MAAAPAGKVTEPRGDDIAHNRVFRSTLPDTTAPKLKRIATYNCHPSVFGERFMLRRY
jgi:hypothetical protein